MSGTKFLATVFIIIAVSMVSAYALLVVQDIVTLGSHGVKEHIISVGIGSVIGLKFYESKMMK